MTTATEPVLQPLEECNEYPEGSRGWQLCNGFANLPLKKINNWRASKGFGPLPNDGRKRPDVVIHRGDGVRVVRNGTTPHQTKRSKTKQATGTDLLGRGVGRTLMELWKAKGYPTCGSCRKLARKMNDWGPRGCRNNKQEIIQDVFPRAKDYVLKQYPKIARMSEGVGRDRVIRLKIWSDVKKAIRQYESEEKQRVSNLVVNHGGHWGTAFRQVGPAEYITYSQLVKDVSTLIGMIPPNTSAVVGVARSGMDVASMIAKHLHLPLYSAAQDRREIVDCGSGYRIRVGAQMSGPVLLVDDTVMTGNSLKDVVPWVQESFEELVTSAIYVNPIALRKPDLWVKDLSWPHLLEWNLFNSIMSQNIAVDFDGILCHDCPLASDDDGPLYEEFLRTARPMPHLPRRTPIPLIVTARLEKYRDLTLQWLDRHGIRVERLVMGPWSSLAERRRSSVADFKADHFDKWARSSKAKPAQPMFIESDDHQARRIHELTGRLVVSPHAGRCYE